LRFQRDGLIGNSATGSVRQHPGIDSINTGQRTTATGAEDDPGDSDSKEYVDEKNPVKKRLAELIPDEFVSTPEKTLSIPDSKTQAAVA
jgi:hypothetical protein